MLGSLAFGVATLSMLDRVKSGHKDIEIVAYLDDVSISGKPESVFLAFDSLCALAKDMQLEVQKEKCEILTSVGGQMDEGLQEKIAQRGLRPQKGAIPLLGSVVGNDVNEIQRLVNEKVDGWKKALELLAHEEIPTQLALLVGRWT